MEPQPANLNAAATENSSSSSSNINLLEMVLILDALNMKFEAILSTDTNGISKHNTVRTELNKEVQGEETAAVSLSDISVHEVSCTKEILSEHKHTEKGLEPLVARPKRKFYNEVTLENGNTSEIHNLDISSKRRRTAATEHLEIPAFRRIDEHCSPHKIDGAPNVRSEETSSGALVKRS